MKTSVHLVSMPWQVFVLPSAAIGSLKAYVDREFSRAVRTHTYSAHAGVFLEAYRDFAPEFSNLSWVELGEIIYFFAFYLRFVPKKKQKLKLSELITAFNRRHKPPRKISFKLIREIESATRRYIDDKIAPNLRSDECNIVGFSINFHQMYSSIFCERYLRARFPEHRFVFLYGGWGGGSPMALDLLRLHGCEGFGVIGEGESKLADIIRSVIGAEEAEFEHLKSKIRASTSGVYHLSEEIDLYERSDKNYQTQFEAIDSLPIPDHDEYFETLKGGLSGASYEWIRDQVFITMEGTRGCFAHCDFCSMNAQWEGFRKMSPETIVEKARSLCDRHGINRILFLDNVCDTWAEEYADKIIESGSRIISEMELRAHHPEQFWTKLALSGVLQIQVGVETIAPALLKQIGKGTRVIQNLCAQKYIAELGIIAGANLITHHPRSTVDDILETRRILKEIPHFPSFELAHFTLDVGSPFFYSLPRSQRRLTRQVLYPIHRSVDSLQAGHGYEFPENYPRGPVKDWDEFVTWFRKFKKDPSVRNSIFTVTKFPSGKLHLIDRRMGGFKEHWLENEEAQVYDLCHAGLKLDAIARLSGLSEVRTRKLLDEFLVKRLVLETEGFFVALALRPRDELINGLLNGSRSSAKSDPLRISNVSGIRDGRQ